jgi:hypothetical protein
MRKTLLVSALFALAGLLPAFAWSPPSVGQTCHGLRGGGAVYEAVAGNYMGGRAAGAGMIDYKSFQACFRSEEGCSRWLAMHQQRYPVGPLMATCTRVTLR